MTDEGDTDSLVGQTIAEKYLVERLVGRGGMGAVYAATHLGINKRIALKFLDREAARDEDSVARFQREAESASAVESAHIVQIFDSGTHEGQPYLVMEMLHGEDLRSRLRREKTLTLADAVHVIGQVLRALARAHAAGIVHRDLKPDNVFLCQRDDDPMFVKIVDFGISKVARRTSTNNTLTRRGTVLGTAFYMSPEQAQASPDIDGRSDLFSAGAILFEALAGRPPHTGEAYEAILIDICTKDAPGVRSFVPDVPEALEKVIARALQRDRTSRYQDAREMYESLAMAVPGLLRGGAGTVSSRDPMLSLPEVSSARGPKTDEGTAVRTGSTDRRAQTFRTAVLVVTVALGAFIATVFLMRGTKVEDPEPASGARGAPAKEPAATPATVAPTASAAPPASVAPEPSASAPAPTPKPQGRPGPRPKPAPAATKPAPKPGPAGVATGLQLDTSGP